MNKAEKYKEYRIEILKKNIDLKKKIYMLSSYIKMSYVLKIAKKLLVNLTLLKDANDKKIFALIQCRAVINRYAKRLYRHYG